MTIRRLVAPLFAVPLLFACESYKPTYEEIGMATGAVVGGVVGHQFGGGHGKTAATIGGAAVGAFVGSRVGSTMDRNDQTRTSQALNGNRDGQSTAWRNTDSGRHYSVTPTRTFGGSYQCREFTTMSEINGRQETVYGYACKQPDGSWRVS